MKKNSLLQEIERLTRYSVEERKRAIELNDLRTKRVPLDFEKAIRDSKMSIIAEVKRMSPSQGELNLTADPATLAQEYYRNGATAISVLTEEHFFKGRIQDLKEVRSEVSLPLLQKDFIIDEFQIHEAKFHGADCVLLIVALLGEEKTRAFYTLAKSIGLSVLVEVHTLEELQVANALRCSLIGINNRNLHSLEVSLEVSRSLISKVHDKALIISESGITSNQEIRALASLGFHGFLIGTSLMKHKDPGGKLCELRSAV